ncbi:unnamed protein product [Litomosoides sigmodontis]|uniref:BTB domain-containing protein n=1 Tax=Litomosoides sigmodontis TaxID=42156 RepID=A0A3P6SZ47_LITSI|nr:unnamed protein product [Litomosoides sigmodontis]
MDAINEYSLHISYRFHGSYFKFQKTFNKLYCCKWTAVKECLSDGDRSASRTSSSGSTENVETIGRPDELIEFVNSVPILYNYDDDITVRFELFCAEKSPLSSSVGADVRRSSDTIVRFRSSSEVLFWNFVDSMECELNAVIHRGRLSEEDDGRVRDGSSVISERVPIIDRVFTEKQIRMEISISQLEKRGKMKYTDLETFLTIHRKNLKEDNIIVYRSPKTAEINSTSLHKFPEIVIPCERLLCGTEDRLIYFTLRNAANGDMIGEADIFYSHLVADGKVNLKLRSRDFNTNILFGISKHSFHPVGVLHVNFHVNNNMMTSPTRSSTECRHRSSVELSSSLSSTEDRYQCLVRNIDEEELGFSRSSIGNVMLASGRTQAYLVSLLAPTIEVRLRQPITRSFESLADYDSPINLLQTIAGSYDPDRLRGYDIHNIDEKPLVASKNHSRQIPEELFRLFPVEIPKRLFLEVGVYASVSDSCEKHPLKSLRPKQPRPYSQPPPPTMGTASNGNQVYNRAIGPLTHLTPPSMSATGGVSRTYLNSSSYVASGNTTMAQMVAAPALGTDPVQQVSVPPPPTSRPPPVYDMLPPEEPTKKMDIEAVKEVIKKEPGLAERVTSLKANGVGFDVDFVIGSTSNTTYFEAHRVVMAAGSKVLERMLFSEVESSSPTIKKRKGPDRNCPVVTIHFSDVDPVAFQTIIDYIYSDFDETAIKIAESAVLNTLYAAKKFEIAALEKHCVELLGELTPSLAVALLEQAVNFGSEELLDRCHQVIDERSDEALSSDSLITVGIETLKKLVKRSELSPSGELSVFKAVCNWAEAECKRRGIEETSENKRLVVGDVLNDIRFPTMTVEELGEAANSGLLNDLEIGVLFRYVTSTVHVGIDLPYPTQERRILSRSRYVVRRFMNLNKNTCKKQRSTIWFIVNREILVTALGIYGLVPSETNAEGSEWKTTVDVEVAASGVTKTTDLTSVTLKGTYGDGRAFIAHLKKPARVVANVPYRATVTFKEEVETFSGGNGQEDILVYVGSGGAVEQNCTGTSPSVDQSSVAMFAFHNDDPNGIRRGMTRGPAVYTDAIGGFYNRPINNVAPIYSEGCLYEGQIPEIHFMAPMEVKKEVSDV